MAIRKIVSRSIGTDVIAAEDLANNSVTVAEITDGAVTSAKMNGLTGSSSGIIQADGDGSLSVTTADLVDDTTPQLGGNLDGQTNTIGDVSALGLGSATTAGRFGSGVTVQTSTPEVHLKRPDGNGEGGLLLDNASSTQRLYVGTYNTNQETHIGTNGTQRIVVTSDGYVTKPNQPAFQAHSGASNTADGNTIIFTTIDYNIGSHYDTSTGRFTAPVLGRYLFTVNGIYTVNSSTATWKWIWRKNGSNTGVLAEWQTSNIAGSYQTIGNSSIILQLAANDYVDIYNDSSSGNGNAHLSGAQSRFCGILLT